MHFLIAPDAISDYYLDFVISLHITLEVTSQGKNPFEYKDIIAL
jgi:hypothetical protein